MKAGTAILGLLAVGAIVVVAVEAHASPQLPQFAPARFAVDQAVTVHSSAGTFTGRVVRVFFGPDRLWRYDVETNGGLLASQPEGNLTP